MKKNDNPLAATSVSKVMKNKVRAMLALTKKLNSHAEIIEAGKDGGKLQITLRTFKGNYMDKEYVVSDTLTPKITELIVEVHEKEMALVYEQIQAAAKEV